MNAIYHDIPVSQAGSVEPTDIAGTLNPTSVTNNSLGFLEKFEGVKADPYIDSVGKPTVGIGWLLSNKDNFNAYMEEIGVNTESPIYTKLSATMSNVWTKVVAGKTIADTASFLAQIKRDYGGPLPSLDDQQIADMWKKVVLHEGTGQYAQFQKLIGARGRNIDTSDLSNSKEGVALFSLFYNGVLGKSPTLLSDLSQSNFNRVDAWYQIRYQSNADNEHAKRRYAESEVFGLYAPTDATAGDVSNDEALSIYSELSKENSGSSIRDTIFSYEGNNNAAIDGANADLAAVYITRDAPAVAGTKVGTLESELQWAASELISHYLSGSASNGLGVAFAQENIISSLDVQVSTSDGDDTLVASHRSGYNLSGSTYQNSMLIAQSGDVTLDGRGTGNNALIGGTGNDTIYVGSGDDYIVAGSGNTVIEGDGNGKAIGAGDDTIVLGSWDAVGDGSHHSDWGGHHTVWGGAGDDTYFISRRNSDLIHLGTGSAVINVVDDETGTYSPLNIQASSIAVAGLDSNGHLTYGTYQDSVTNSIIFSSTHIDGTRTLKVFTAPLPGSAPAPHALAQAEALNVMGAEDSWSDLAEAIVSVLAEGFSTEGVLSAGVVQGLYDDYAATGSSAGTGNGGMLEIDGFVGTNDAGIELTDVDPTQQGSVNTNTLRKEVYPINSETVYYDDMIGGTAPSIFGEDASPGSLVVINGEGNASYIQAGDGNQFVFIGDGTYTALNPLDIDLSAVVQGGTGTQTLVGVGNGHDTLIGGASGTDSSVWTTIDAGGADALSVGGGQNSVIWGGTGRDTIVASSADGVGSPGFNPATLAVAGISFWGSSWFDDTGGFHTVYEEPAFSIAFSDDPGSFQVQLQLYQPDGTLGQAFGLLGSEYDPEVGDGSSTLPGTMLTGGTGLDFLIGNVGDDTIIGGTPLASQDGVVDEVLVGGAGSDLIYGGEGNDFIFTNLSPGASADWADADAGSSDTVYGGSGNEYIWGSGGNNVIHGGSGNYTIYVGNGDSYIETGDGNSIVYGGDGNEFIVAGSGSDSIETGDGDTYVYAGAGESTIYAGAGADTLEAGAGTTYYVAGSGDETYLFGGAGGTQQIFQAGSASSITIRFTPDVDPGDIVARRDDRDNLILINEISGREVAVVDYFTDGGTASNVSVLFADGVVWDGTALLAGTMTASNGDDYLVGSSGNDTIEGGPGNDTISGLGGSNVLVGGSGNTTLIGGSGSDTMMGGEGSALIQGGSGSETYVFDVDSGSETIAPYAYGSGSDALVFGEGIERSSVSFAHVGNGSDLLVTFGDSSMSTVTIKGFFTSSPSQSHQVTTFRFADGTSLTTADVMALAGSNQVSDNGDDTIVGGDGNNQINGGTGSDTLIGGSGNNTIRGGSGNESIVGGTGENTIYGGSGSNDIVAGPNGDLIFAGSGVTTVTGGDGNDTVHAGGGSLLINASLGSDEYDFGLGAGKEHLTGYSYTLPKDGEDILRIGDGLTAADLTYSRVGTPGYDDDALVIGVKGTDDLFVIDDFFSNASPEPDSLAIAFANGSSLNYADLVTKTDESSAWNGVSNQEVGPFNGEDVPIRTFGRGDGAVSLSPSGDDGDGSTGDDQDFWLGPGVREQDIVLEAHGDSIILSIRGTSDSLFLDGLLNGSVNGYAITNLHFDNGEVWDLPTVLAHVSYGAGTAGHVIEAPDPGVTLVSSEANDTINAVDGDIVYFGYGSGQMTVNFDDQYGNVLRFGEGIDPGDVLVTAIGSGVEFTLKSTGETLTIRDRSGGSGGGPGYYTTYPIERAEFADGAVWDAGNIGAMSEIGVPIEDFEAHAAQAPSGIDVLITGLLGGEVILGTDDSYVYVGDGYNSIDQSGTVVDYGLGDGNTTITGSSVPDGPQNQILRFEQGISLSDLHVSVTFDSTRGSYEVPGGTGRFETDGDGFGTLVLTIGDTGKTITIPYQVYDSEAFASISGFQFDNGDTVDIATIITSVAPDFGAIQGSRGPDTLSGGAGASLHVALGNTAILGVNEKFYADLSPLADPAVAPAQTTYEFTDETDGDQVTANIYSTIKFAPDISSSDVALIGPFGPNEDVVIYRKDTGSYIALHVDGPATAPDLEDHGSWITLDFADATYTNYPVYIDTLRPDSAFVEMNASGQKGYYADTFDPIGGYKEAYILGAATNAVFGGSAWNRFDASSGAFTRLAPSAQASLAGVNLGQGVDFTFASGLGDDEIVRYDAGELNVRMAAGISRDQVSLSEQGSDVVLEVSNNDGTSSQLRIDNFYSESAGGMLSENSFTLTFADGTSLDADGVKNAMYANSGDIWLVTPGTSLVDLSWRGGLMDAPEVTVQNDGQNHIAVGESIIDASRGDNTFVVSSTSSAYVHNFSADRDTVQFESDVEASNIRVAYNNFGDGDDIQFIDAGTGNMLIELRGNDLLGNSDFSVSFADGTSWNGVQIADGMPMSPDQSLIVGQYVRGVVGDELLVGGQGNDVVASDQGADTLNGGGGRDTLYAGDGDDTFQFGHGSGADTIVGRNDGAHANTLAFGADVSSGNVSVVRVDKTGNLEIVLNDTGESVLLANFLDGTAKEAVQVASFADGTLWSASDLVAMSHQGSQVSGYLVADEQDQLIIGRSGNDTIVGYAGTDVLIAGSGSTTIISGNGSNTIFDGTGANTIRGGSGSDLIVAGAGDATIYGGVGAERYQFGSAFGHVDLLADGHATSNEIDFVDGVMASDVSFSMSASGDLVASLDSGQGSIVLPNHLAGRSTVGDIGKIGFADGGTVSMEEIDALVAQNQGAPVHFVPDAAYASTIAEGASRVIAHRSDYPDHLTIDATGHVIVPGHSASTVSSDEDGSASKPTTGVDVVTTHQQAMPPGAGFIRYSDLAGSDSNRLGMHGHAADEVEDGRSGPSLGSQGVPRTDQPATEQEGPNPHSSAMSAVTLLQDGLEDRRLKQGAPVDRFATDEEGGRGIALSVPLGGGAFGRQSSRKTPVFSRNERGQSIIRSAGAANEMVRALTAQDDLMRGHSLVHGSESRESIQLQGGTVWTMSEVDQVLAGISHENGIRSTAFSDATVGTADLAHAQLITAMASFSPVAASMTGTITDISDSYAISLAAQAH